MGTLLEDGEHALFVRTDGGGKPCRFLVADALSEVLERPIGRDLKRLCGALVLRVLQQLLLGAGAAEKIKRALAEGEGLADETLESPYACHDHAPTLAELLETLLQGCRVGLGLAKVALPSPFGTAPRGVIAM